MANNKSLRSRKTKILTLQIVPQLQKHQDINTDYSATITDTIPRDSTSRNMGHAQDKSRARQNLKLK